MQDFELQRCGGVGLPANDGPHGRDGDVTDLRRDEDVVEGKPGEAVALVVELDLARLVAPATVMPAMAGKLGAAPGFTLSNAMVRVTLSPREMVLRSRLAVTAAAWRRKQEINRRNRRQRRDFTGGNGENGVRERSEVRGRESGVGWAPEGPVALPFQKGPGRAAAPPGADRRPRARARSRSEESRNWMNGLVDEWINGVRSLGTGTSALTLALSPRRGNAKG